MTRDPRWTLPELLFAVAGTCLLLLALSAHSATPGGLHVAEVVDQIHIALQMARLEAVAGAAPARVVIDPRAGRLDVRRENAVVHGLALPRGVPLTWIDGELRAQGR